MAAASRRRRRPELLGMTEPEHAGSNPVWLGTTARREGDEYVLDGHKWFTSAGRRRHVLHRHGGHRSRRPESVRPASQILVPLDCQGFEVVQNLAVMGERGEGWMSHAEVRLEGVRVPVANRIGAEGGGFSLAQERLGPGRIHHCMRWIGICERAFDLMCGGRDARAFPGQAAGHADSSSRPGSPRAERRSTPPASSCCARPGASTARSVRRAGRRFADQFHTAGTLQRVLDRAIQTHGALGLTRRRPSPSGGATSAEPAFTTARTRCTRRRREADPGAVRDGLQQREPDLEEL